MTVGLTFKSADEVNAQSGMILRRFVDIKESIQHLHASLAALDLQGVPFGMPADDETVIKSAVNGLNTDLSAIDMTFIERLTGAW